MPKDIIKTRVKGSSGTFAGNIAKSIKYSGIELIGQSAPNMTEFKTTNSELLRETMKAFRDYKSYMKMAKGQIEQSDAYKAAGAAKENLFKDIKSGKLYNKERMKEVEAKSMDLGGFDDLDSFGGGSNIGSTKTIAATVAKSTSASTAILGDIISKTSMASTEAIIANQKSIHTVDYTTRQQMHSELMNVNTYLGDSINRITEFNLGTMTPYVDVSIRYYEDSINMMKAMNDNLKTIAENTVRSAPVAEVKTSSDPKYFSDISSGGIPDIKDYGKVIEKNIKTMLDGPLSFLSLFKSMAGDNPFMGMAASPLAFIPRYVASMMIPKDFTKELKKLDHTFSNSFAGFITSMNSMALNDDNSTFAKYLGEILGMKGKGKTGVDISNIQRGAISFDGDTKIAITETIPYHLRKIEALLSGREERIFDITTGGYVTASEAKKRYEQEKDRALMSPTSGYMSDVTNAIKETFAITNKEFLDTINKDMRELVKFAQKHGVMVSPERKGEADRLSSMGFEVNPATWDMISGAMSGMGKEFIMEMNKSFLEGRENLDRYMTSLEKDRGNPIFQVLSDEKNIDSHLKKKKVNGKDILVGGKGSATSPFVDKFGYSQNDYLRDIKKILLDGIVTYSYNMGGGRRGRSSGPLNNTDLDARRQAFDRDMSNFTDPYLKAQEDALKAKERYEEAIKKHATNKGLKTIDSQYSIGDDVYGETKSSISETLRIKKEKAKADKKSESLLGSNDDMFVKFRDMKDKFQTFINKPYEPLIKLMRNVDKKIYAILYGTEDSDGDSIFTKLLKKTEGVFSDFSGFMNEKILNPLHEKLFGDEGIITKIQEKITNSSMYKKGKDAINTFFGEDIERYKEKFKEFFISGENSVFGNMKDMAGTIKRGFLDTVLGKGTYSEDADGKLTLISRNDDGLLSSISNSFKSFVNWGKDTIFGGEEGMKTLEENIEKYAPRTLAGAGLGLIGSLFLPGGPVLGALIGGSAAFASASDEVKDYLFGNLDTEGNRLGGLISKEVQDKLGEYAPKSVAGGALGVIGSLFLPGGPVLGAILGSTAAFASQTETVKSFLFGKMGDEGFRDGKDAVFSKEMQDNLKKYIPASLLGAGAGYGITSILGATTNMGLLGSVMLGPVSGILLGGALGVASQSEKFKAWMFGDKDEQGLRQGGLTGKISDWVRLEMIEPMKIGFMKINNTMYNWFHDNIGEPFKDALGPLKQELKNLGSTVKDMFKGALDNVKNGITDMFGKAIGTPIGEIIKEKVADPLADMIKKMTSGIGKVLGKILSAPFKILRESMLSVSAGHILSGQGDYIGDRALERERSKATRADKNAKDMEAIHEREKKLDIMKHLRSMKNMDFDTAMKSRLYASNFDKGIVDELYKKGLDPKDITSGYFKDFIDEYSLKHPKPKSGKNDIWMNGIKQKNVNKMNTNTVVAESGKATVDVISTSTNILSNNQKEQIAEQVKTNSYLAELTGRGDLNKLSPEYKAHFRDSGFNSKRFSYKDTVNYNKYVNPAMQDHLRVNSDYSPGFKDLKNQMRSSGGLQMFSDKNSARAKDSTTSNYNSTLLSEVKGIKGILTKTLSFFESNLNNVGSNLDAIRNMISSNMGAGHISETGNRRGRIGGIFGFITNMITKPFDFAFNLVKNTIEMPFKLMGSVAKNFTGAIGNVVGMLTKVPGVLLDITSNIVTNTGKMVSNALDISSRIAKGVIDTSMTIMESSAKAISGAVSGIFKATFDTIGALTKGMSSLVTNVIPAMLQTTGAMIGGAVRGAGAAFRGLGSLAGGIFGFVNPFGRRRKYNPMTAEGLTRVTIEGGYLDKVTSVNTVYEVEPDKDENEAAEALKKILKGLLFGEENAKKDMSDIIADKVFAKLRKADKTDSVGYDKNLESKIKSSMDNLETPLNQFGGNKNLPNYTMIEGPKRNVPSGYLITPRDQIPTATSALQIEAPKTSSKMKPGEDPVAFIQAPNTGTGTTAKGQPKLIALPPPSDTKSKTSTSKDSWKDFTEDDYYANLVKLMYGKDHDPYWHPDLDKNGMNEKQRKRLIDISKRKGEYYIPGEDGKSGTRVDRKRIDDLYAKYLEDNPQNEKAGSYKKMMDDRFEREKTDREKKLLGFTEQTAENTEKQVDLFEAFGEGLGKFMKMALIALGAIGAGLAGFAIGKKAFDMFKSLDALKDALGKQNQVNNINNTFPEMAMDPAFASYMQDLGEVTKGKIETAKNKAGAFGRTALQLGLLHTIGNPNATRLVARKVKSKANQGFRSMYNFAKDRPIKPEGFDDWIAKGGPQRGLDATDDIKNYFKYLEWEKTLDADFAAKMQGKNPISRGFATFKRNAGKAMGNNAWFHKIDDAVTSRNGVAGIGVSATKGLANKSLGYFGGVKNVLTGKHIRDAVSLRKIGALEDVVSGQNISELSGKLTGAASEGLDNMIGGRKLTAKQANALNRALIENGMGDGLKLGLGDRIAIRGGSIFSAMDEVALANSERIGRVGAKIGGSSFGRGVGRTADALSQVYRKPLGGIGKGMTSAASGVDSKSGKIVGKIGKGLMNVGEGGLTGIIRQKMTTILGAASKRFPSLAKHITAMAPKLGKEVAEKAGKKGGSKLLAGLLSGGTLTAAMAAYDIASGAHDVRNIFQIPEHVEPDAKMRFAAGVGKAISNFATLGILPHKVAAEFAYKAIATDGDIAALKDMQGGLKDEYEDYMTAYENKHGEKSSMTFEDYNNKQNKTLWSKATSFLKTKPVKIAKTVVQAAPPIGMITSLGALGTKQTRENFNLKEDEKVGLLRRVSSYLATVLEKMTMGWLKAEELVKPVHGALLYVKDGLKFVGNKVSDFFGFVKDSFSAFNKRFIRPIWDKFLKPVGDAIGKLWNSAKRYFPFLEKIEKAFRYIKELPGKIKEALLGKGGFLSKLSERSDKESKYDKIQDVFKPLINSDRDFARVWKSKGDEIVKNPGHSKWMDWDELRPYRDEFKEAASIMRGSGQGAVSNNNTTTNNYFYGSGTVNGKPYFSQTDPRWAKARYAGKSNMANSGCGPTAAAIAASSLGIKSNPMEAASFGRATGFSRVGGTPDTYFAPYMANKGVRTARIPNSAGAIASQIAKGRPVILGGNSSNSGPYTKAGHYVVATGIKNGKIQVSDPRGRSKSRAYNPSEILNNTKVAITAARARMIGRGEDVYDSKLEDYTFEGHGLWSKFKSGLKKALSSPNTDIFGGSAKFADGSRKKTDLDRQATLYAQAAKEGHFNSGGFKDAYDAIERRDPNRKVNKSNTYNLRNVTKKVGNAIKNAGKAVLKFGSRDAAKYINDNERARLEADTYRSGQYSGSLRGFNYENAGPQDLVAKNLVFSTTLAKILKFGSRNTVGNEALLSIRGDLEKRGITGIDKILADAMAGAATFERREKERAEVELKEAIERSIKSGNEAGIMRGLDQMIKDHGVGINDAAFRDLITQIKRKYAGENYYPPLIRIAEKYGIYDLKVNALNSGIEYYTKKGDLKKANAWYDKADKFNDRVTEDPSDYMGSITNEQMLERLLSGQNGRLAGSLKLNITKLNNTIEAETKALPGKEKDIAKLLKADPSNIKGALEIANASVDKKNKQHLGAYVYEKAIESAKAKGDLKLANDLVTKAYKDTTKSDPYNVRRDLRGHRVKITSDLALDLYEKALEGDKKALTELENMTKSGSKKKWFPNNTEVSRYKLGKGVHTLADYKEAIKDIKAGFNESEGGVGVDELSNWDVYGEDTGMADGIFPGADGNIYDLNTPLPNEDVYSNPDAYVQGIDAYTTPGTLGYQDYNSTGVGAYNSAPTQSSNLTTPSGAVNGIIAEAMKHIGKPYVFGATGPNSFDCSSFTQWAYKHGGGISIPRTAQTQYDMQGATPVDRSQLQPGDLIFWEGTYKTNNKKTHVGISLGGDDYIAAEGKAVRTYQLSKVTSTYGGAKRVLAVGQNGGVQAVNMGSPTSAYDWKLSQGKRSGSSSKGNPVYTGSVRGLGVDSKKFIDIIAPSAAMFAPQYRVPPSLQIAQAAVETGWGKRAIGNNLFGIKEGSSWSGPVLSTSTSEYGSGGKYSTTALFRHYNSLHESIGGHAKLLGTSSYYSGVPGRTFAQIVGSSALNAYATDPSYRNLLKSVYSSNNLGKYDDPAMIQQLASQVAKYGTVSAGSDYSVGDGSGGTTMVTTEEYPDTFLERVAGIGTATSAYMEAALTGKAYVDPFKSTEEVELPSNTTGESYGIGGGDETLFGPTANVAPGTIAPLFRGKVRVTSPYGAREAFRKGKAHNGVDYGVGMGTPLYAALAGVIEKAKDSGDGYGKNVNIRTNSGHRIVYGHLSKLGVQAGQTVRTGDYIGNVGSTGHSTGPHLHYEYRKPGGGEYSTRLNPAPVTPPIGSNGMFVGAGFSGFGDGDLSWSSLPHGGGYRASEKFRGNEWSGLGVGFNGFGLNEDVDILRDNSVIKSPDYWKTNAVLGKTVKSEFVEQLLRNAAPRFDIKDSSNIDIDSLVDGTISGGVRLNSPDYWTSSIKGKKPIAGEHAARLLALMAGTPAFRSNGGSYDFDNSYNPDGYTAYESYDRRGNYMDGETYNTNSLYTAVEILHDKKVLSDRDFWRKHARPSMPAIYHGKVLDVMKSFSKVIGKKPSTDVSTLLGNMQTEGVSIHNPEYWGNYLKGKKDVDAGFVQLLLTRMAMIPRFNYTIFDDLPVNKEGFEAVDLDRYSNELVNNENSPFYSDINIPSDTNSVNSDILGLVGLKPSTSGGQNIYDLSDGSYTPTLGDISNAYGVEKDALSSADLTQFSTTNILPIRKPGDFIGSGLAEDVAALERSGVISSGDYWKTNSVAGKSIDGKYAKALLENIAKKFEISYWDDTSLVSGLYYDGNIGINSPDYWMSNLGAGKTIEGDTMGKMLSVLAKNPRLGSEFYSNNAVYDVDLSAYSPIGNTIHDPIKFLQDHGIIQSPEYWRRVSGLGNNADANVILQLFKKTAKRLGIQEGANTKELVNNMLKSGIGLQSPEFWVNAIDNNKPIPGDYILKLLTHISNSPALESSRNFTELDSTYMPAGSLQTVYGSDNFNIGQVSDYQLYSAIDILNKGGIISDVEYWKNNARPSAGPLNYHNVIHLMEKYHKKAGGKATRDIDTLLNTLKDNNVPIYNPEYWGEYLVKGKDVDPSFAQYILVRMAKSKLLGSPDLNISDKPITNIDINNMLKPDTSYGLDGYTSTGVSGMLTPDMSYGADGYTSTGVNGMLTPGMSYGSDGYTSTGVNGMLTPGMSYGVDGYTSTGVNGMLTPGMSYGSDGFVSTGVSGMTDYNDVYYKDSSSYSSRSTMNDIYSPYLDGYDTGFEGLGDIELPSFDSVNIGEMNSKIQRLKSVSETMSGMGSGQMSDAQLDAIIALLESIDGRLEGISVDTSVLKDIASKRSSSVDSMEANIKSETNLNLTGSNPFTQMANKGNKESKTSTKKIRDYASTIAKGTI